MRSKAGMANRQGDVDLRFARVSAPQLTLWLGLASEKQFGRSNLPVAHQEGSSARLYQDSRNDARLPSHDAS